MFKCPECGKEYKSEAWLMKHVAKTHGGEVTEETQTSTAPPDEEEYDSRWLQKCPKCGHPMPIGVVCCWYCEYCLDDNIRGKVPEKRPKVVRKKMRRKKK